MNNSPKYEAVLRKSRPKYMPKKLLKHAKLTVNEKYTANACIWIPDTPESNFRPAVCLKLQHNDQEIRLIFKSAADMIIAVEELRRWVGLQGSVVYIKHQEAIREWLAYHANQMPTPIDDYTVLTVIQDEKGGNLEKNKEATQRHEE